MELLKKVEVVEIPDVEWSDDSIIKIRFGDDVINFTHDSTSRDISWKDNNAQNITKFVNYTKNFPYNILLLHSFDKNVSLELIDYHKNEKSIPYSKTKYLGNILFSFFYKEFLVCIQQKETEKLNAKMECCNYYKCDIITSLEKLKNFQINNLLTNDKNKFIVEYQFLKEQRRYSKAEIIKFEIENELYYILISRIESSSLIGFIYFVPSMLLFKLQNDKKYIDKEYILVNFKSMTLSIPLLPYHIDIHSPFTSYTSNIYSSFMSKSIILCIAINPFILMRDLNNFNRLNHSFRKPSDNYSSVLMTDMGFHEEELSSLLHCKLENLNALMALEEKQRNDEEAERIHERSLLYDYDKWDDLEFEQKLDRDPNRAMNDAERDAYWIEDERNREAYFESNLHLMLNNEMRYVFCGYSKDFLHFEKIFKNDGIDYYETVIVDVMHTNFILNEKNVYIGFINNSKLVIASFGKGKKLIAIIHEALRPNTQFQLIESHSINLSIEI